MKRIILSVALVATTFAFAQKKEVAAAFKAVEANDMTTAKAEVAAAERAIGGRTYLLDPETLEKFYYAKGVSLIKSGQIAEGAEVLSHISELGNSSIYTGKNSNRDKVYYVGKKEAAASGISGLKEESYTPTTLGKLGNIVNPLLQTANKEAMDAYNAKEYAKAAPKFVEVYNLLKAAGQDNQQYLYYSAITYALANDKPNAIKSYAYLIDSGYTGVATTYTAKNKKTGEVQTFDKATWELYKKMGATAEYTDFKTETSPSVEQELYETQAALLVDNSNYDEALKVIDAGLKKFPKSTKLSELRGTAYYKSGNTDEFFNSLKEAVAANPQDKASWYNMAVLASKDETRKAEAEGYFKKSLEIDPNYIPALQGIFYNVYMGDDAAVIESAEKARKSGKMDEFNKILEERRARFAKGLPYVERWYNLEKDNLDVVSLLKGLYQTTRNDAKFKEFKAKEEALEAKNK